MVKRNIIWFRQDLRVKDNPALVAAAKSGVVLPVFIDDSDTPQAYQRGASSQWWLHSALTSLNDTLHGHLICLRGSPLDCLLQLVRQYKIDGLYFNRCYDQYTIKRDQRISRALKESNVDVFDFSATLLWEPTEILKKDGTPYRVFTPYYRKGCLKTGVPRQPLSAPRAPKFIAASMQSATVAALKLMPAIAWYQSLDAFWSISEKAAHSQLNKFVKKHISKYKKSRDMPGLSATSFLSPYLHFGQLSPHQVWYAVAQSGDTDAHDVFLSELGWREFSYYLLYYFPLLYKKNIQSKFDAFPWRYKRSYLLAWQRGQTGYPVVDAGMRQLYQTGYMHNRVRMIVASFLVKNLLQDWRKGAAWFWDCLVDADLASNSASWQWVAGCGADAAPYFRIFNPVLQGEKFDSDGAYTRHYVPELERLDKKYLHKPWAAPKSILEEAGVVLGENYPFPIVDLKSSRQAALEAYQQIK